MKLRAPRPLLSPGEHTLILGGSFASCGDEASVFARFHFRPHFHNLTGFRVARQPAAGAPPSAEAVLRAAKRGHLETLWPLLRAGAAAWFELNTVHALVEEARAGDRGVEEERLGTDLCRCAFLAAHTGDALSVRGAGELLARGELRALAVLVLGPAPGDGSPPPVLERFVFDLRTTSGTSAESPALRAQLALLRSGARRSNKLRRHRHPKTFVWYTC